MNVVRFLRIAFLVGLITIPCSLKVARAADSPDTDRAVLEGRKLSEEEAQQLEETLKHTPEDLAIRAKLLGYYSSRHLRSEWIDGIAQREVLWLIEHHPEAQLTGLPYAQFDFNSNPSAYEQGAALWKQQVATHTNEPLVLRNAARYFLLHDRPLAEELFKKGAALEPQNADWPNALGHLYLLGFNKKTPEEQKFAAVAALGQYEQAYALTAEGYKAYLVNDLAKCAFDAGDMKKAKMYAELSLQATQSGKKDWNLGNDIFFGNMVLGRLALKMGDVEQAKHYLIESGKTPGSPQLGSFGPNMTLAKELLEKGEKDTVLEFFDLCGKFWKYQPRLTQWTDTVKAGGIPDFGANLVY